MQHRANILGRIAQNAHTKLLLIAVSFHATVAQAALTRVDLTQDASGGKTLTNVAENGGNILDSVNSLMLAIAAFIGLIITIMSAYTIWKAAKDEREKPTSAIVGIFIGGLMLAVPTIMWISRNSLLGN
ncbi:DUF6750 family protein [Bordetella flabilis]|uniref:Conjugal transfer protein n=1 Tax=Bordetella flabilis TaxID=463014 RepID=A0A193GMJ0_9BORD|nr:DUF6750 family protein [Bordetella flabilis]ANN80818.1 hypothetical protein BAU07_26175 [Bordetella flabilis]